MKACEERIVIILKKILKLILFIELNKFLLLFYFKKKLKIILFYGPITAVIPWVANIGQPKALKITHSLKLCLQFFSKFNCKIYNLKLLFLLFLSNNFIKIKKLPMYTKSVQQVSVTKWTDRNWSAHIKKWNENGLRHWPIQILLKKNCFSSWAMRSLSSKDRAFRFPQMTHITQWGIKSQISANL